jgi:hypothetical protein
MPVFSDLRIFAIRKTCRILTVWLGRAAVLLAACSGFQAHAQLRYDTEYPVIGYGTKAPQDRFTQVMQELSAQGKTLAYDADGRGYLDSLLQALGIDPSSQVLVWSKTSLKQRYITPENPRSLFFNDEVYVGFVPGSSSLEIGVMDPELGPVFFDYFQSPEAPEPFKQETNRCLRCHDTYSMTGGGVPRFLLSSVLAGTDGSIVSHEISEITDTSTPLNLRWGGWYVTGKHGSQKTMGNFIVDSADKLRNPDFAVNGNKTTLAEYVDLGRYARPTSDIVALLVLEHQAEVQNRITRLNYDSRMLLEREPEPAQAELDKLIRPLLDSLFMANETPLTDKVEGTSGYQQYFASQGPADAQGRSLRELDLQTRTFRYPLSYLIYSPAIKALATPVRERLFRQISAVLNNAADAVEYPHVNADERAAILGILQATYPEVLP